MKGQMEENFEHAAFNTKPGDLSEIVETKNGFHLILVEEHR